MTLRPLTRAEVRSIDQRAAEELGLPTLVLMENAGRGATEILLSALAPGDRVLIACGTGNNGGDGAVVARHLDTTGHLPRVVWFGATDRLRGDAATQHTILARAGISQETWDFRRAEAELRALFDTADWIVDGVLGTGLDRPVTGALKTVIEAMNASGKPVLALDLPSGLDCDMGAPQGATVRARLTATFVAAKRGFAQPGARGFTGAVHIVDIGVPRCLLTPFEPA